MSDVDLSVYDDDYVDAEAPSREAVPDGMYQVYVESLSLKTTKKEPPRPMLTWWFKVINGDCQGRSLFSNAVLPERPGSDASKEDKKRYMDKLGYIKADMAICGFELKNLSDLSYSLDTFEGLQLEVKVKNVKKGDENNQNVYIQRKIALDEDGHEVGADDIPF